MNGASNGACAVCQSSGVGCWRMADGVWQCFGARPIAPDNWVYQTRLNSGARVYSPKRKPRTDVEATSDDNGWPVLLRAADVVREPVYWLWPNRFALGKLTLLCGDPGLGKSILTLDMAARVSTGAAWADGSGCAPRGGVILLSAEDDPADTICPRLDAAGADDSRIEILTAVRKSGASRPSHFSLETDLSHLQQAAESVSDVRLIVIDPISAYLGTRVDSHKNSDVRTLLAPLGELAGRIGAAIVLVTHLSKGGGGKAVYRAMASLAFMAAARTAWLVAADRERPERRLLLAVKSNLAAMPDGLAYEITGPADRAYVAWLADPVAVTADEALADDWRGGDGDGRDALGEAADWLRDALAAGPVAADELLGAARKDGIARRTLQRAKSELGVKSCREGFGNGSRWVWRLPTRGEPSGTAAEGCQN